MATFTTFIVSTIFCMALAKPQSNLSGDAVNVVVGSAAETIEPAVGVAQVPAQIGTAISKTVHYAETPVVSGYTSTLYKADLSAFDTPFKFNMNQRYLRPVKTIIPKVMIEPKTHVEIPVVAQLKELEVHPPILPEVRVANPVFYPPVLAPLLQ